jgi:hypothetical protein
MLGEDSMQDGTIGIIALVFINIIVSLILNISYKKFVNASFISGIL